MYTCEAFAATRTLTARETPEEVYGEMDRRLKKALWPVIYLVAMVLFWGLILGEFKFVLIFVIGITWLVLAWAIFMLTKKITNNYHGPEGLVAGPGLYWAIALGVVVGYFVLAHHLIRVIVS
jgi:hypothetical protein